MLAESFPKQLYTHMPMIWLRPKKMSEIDYGHVSILDFNFTYSLTSAQYTRPQGELVLSPQLDTLLTSCCISICQCRRSTNKSTGSREESPSLLSSTIESLNKMSNSLIRLILKNFNPLNFLNLFLPQIRLIN